ncbi:MAG: efflux RND transporter periplasmic adaptor subunit [Desulfatiglans sp.]|jgi:RND family efflux transporter MFP subunit|nr:efflux RND transporter periplasmic adaptor subunit [Thermodesulfobacteriota bacterium]MEE4354718.1 efflux RND transporter periplasmic adaptor subunit [Desulfatiglans sp.]
MMRRYLDAIGLCIAVILLPACQPAGENEAVLDRPVPVVIETIMPQDLPVIVESVGRLEPVREVILSAEVPGIVQAYTADMGDRVVQGQILVKLKPTDYLLALNEARANLSAAMARFDAAEKTFNRFKALLPRKVITEEAFERAEAEYKSAKATVSQMETIARIAEHRLSKTDIKAPYTGFVTTRMVDIGQTVGVGEAAIGLADMSLMRVRIHLSEQDYIHLDRDDPVEVKIEAVDESMFRGSVDQVGIKADPRTNTFEVKILVENRDIRLKAGLTARVFITSRVIHNAIMIPQSSILYRENGREVFVVNGEEEAVPRKVRLGGTHGSSAIVLEGLAPGDRLVVRGGQYLKSGDRVTISD